MDSFGGASASRYGMDQLLASRHAVAAGEDARVLGLSFIVHYFNAPSAVEAELGVADRRPGQWRQPALPQVAAIWGKK